MYFCAAACCSTSSRDSSRRVATSGSFTQAGLLGVLGDELDAHEVFLDLFTIFGRQLAQRPARSASAYSS